MKRVTSLRRLRRVASALRGDTSGLALLEFAFTLPILLVMSLTGAELTHYITTKMRVSQLALFLADNAARMGEGSLLSAKTISETDINDVLTGAELQAGGLDLYGNGRVIISSLVPQNNPNDTNKYKITWQRCRGAKTGHASMYGDAGDENLDGIGKAGRLVTAQADNATMFVEVYYEYQPIVSGRLAPSVTLDEIASMPVRDRRDLSDDTKKADGTTNPNPTHPLGIYNAESATISDCETSYPGNNGNGGGNGNGNNGNGNGNGGGNGSNGGGNGNGNNGNGNGNGGSNK